MICLKLQKYLLVLLVSISAVFLSMTSECRAETGTKAEDVIGKKPPVSSRDNMRQAG